MIPAFSVLKSSLSGLKSSLLDLKSALPRVKSVITSMKVAGTYQVSLLHCIHIQDKPTASFPLNPHIFQMSPNCDTTILIHNDPRLSCNNSPLRMFYNLSHCLISNLRRNHDKPPSIGWLKVGSFSKFMLPLEKMRPFKSLMNRAPTSGSDLISAFC